MYTPTIVFAFIGLFSLDQPQWVKDYSLARQHGKEQRKPLAVFVASGKTGWDKISQEGQLDKEVHKILAAHYVCVYVDADKAPGERLANAFELTDRLGLVISDGTGALQAFWHAGGLANEDLVKYLLRYADPQRVTRRTETTSPNGIRAIEQAPEATIRQAGYYSPPSGYYPAHEGGGGRSC